MIEMDFFSDIHAKRVLITGASSGIGAATARLFGRLGAAVGIHYRTGKVHAEKIAKEIEGKASGVHLLEGDLLEKKVRETLIINFVKKFEGIDILINNAGASYDYMHFLELSECSWDKTFELNAKAPFILCRNAFPYMQSQGWGRIINISTVAIKYGGVSTFHYTASKAALESITTGLAKAGAQHNILVNAIRCGVIDTPMHSNIEGYNKENFNKRVNLIPLRRSGSPIDIANMTVYLASNCGDFITGEVLAVSGGD